jgi:hypothetical protein
MSTAEDDRLDAAVEAITFGVFDSGALQDPQRWWPRSYVPYSPLFAQDFHSRWIEDWRRLSPDGVSARSTALWVLLAMSSRSLKAMCDRAERCEIVLGLLAAIEDAKEGDIFCRDGRNLVLADETAQELVDNGMFEEVAGGPLDASYARLSATLLAYSEAVFFSANCTVREVHGPYDVQYRGKPAKLIVRDYFRLRDSKLEIETGAFGADAASVYSLYRPQLEFEFSVLNDYVSNEPLGQAAIGHAAEYVGADGRVVPLDGRGALELADRLQRVIDRVSETVEEFDAEREIAEVVRRTYYRAAPLAEAVPRDWEPSHELIAGLLEALPEFAATMPPPLTREAFAVMVDPRG